MTGNAVRNAADEPCGYEVKPDRRFGLKPWLVALSGLAFSLLLALTIHLLERTAASGVILVVGLATTAGITALLRFRAVPQAQVEWRALTDDGIIDGYALWDAEDRLVEQSGLDVYLPQLAQWRSPTARQVITAFVDFGHFTLLPGCDRDQTIETLCHLRKQVPGLRALRMTDGQVALARTVQLPEGGHATVFYNITEFNKAQQTHRVHEDTFRDVFQSAPSMMVLLDAAKRPLAVNRAFQTTLGYPLDHLAELGWDGILHPDAGAAPWSAGTRRFVTADGSVVRGLVQVSPVRDAEDRSLVTIEDVTARWESDERIRLQAALLEHIGSAMLAVDRHGRVSYGNPAAQALFQWSDAVLPGTPVERLLGPGIRAALDSDISEIELEGTTWSGSHFPVQTGIARMVDGSGNPAGAALVVVDLTPRRAMDLHLMHSARLATLGEMAASIAHEFNQCLHVIRLASEALGMDLGEGTLDPARVAKRCSNILTQVDRLTEMVSHMRTISRRDNAGKRPFRPQVALDAALRMMEPLLQVEGIVLVRQGRLGHRSTLGHQVRLEQVLLNLFNNARDSIRERCQRDGNTGGTVTVACSAENNRVCITLSDDGVGVPDHVGHHIFEPFFTTKDEGRGCGLGLSISRGICAEMGGSLTFRNLDRGAKFTIDLPEMGAALAEEPTLPAPLTPSFATTMPQGSDPNEDKDEDEDEDDDEDFTQERRLLLVDDEALSVMMVSEFLERQGYVVDTAYDGLEALDKCQIHVYHAVITDIRMPRMDGHELISRLNDLQPGTPVIVVSGHLKERRVTELGPNVVAMLSKPFQLQDLRDHLARVDHRVELQEIKGM